MAKQFLISDLFISEMLNLYFLHNHIARAILHSLFFIYFFIFL